MIAHKRNALIVAMGFACAVGHQPLIANEVFTDLDKVNSIPLLDVVGVAARIARVRIDGRKPVAFWGLVDPGQKMDSRMICGYYYRATVLENLKGSGTALAFFSAVDADFSDGDQEYLVFLRKRDPTGVAHSVDAIRDLVRAGEVGDLKCKTYGEYYVPVQPQLMIAFSSVAASKFGGQWLGRPNRDSVSWCHERVGSKATIVIGSREVLPGDRTRVVLEWSGIRAAILAANSWLGFVGRDPQCTFDTRN